MFRPKVLGLRCRLSGPRGPPNWLWRHGDTEPPFVTGMSSNGATSSLDYANLAAGCFRKPHMQPFGGTVGLSGATLLRWDRSPYKALSALRCRARLFRGIPAGPSPAKNFRLFGITQHGEDLRRLAVWRCLRRSLPSTPDGRATPIPTPVW